MAIEGVIYQKVADLSNKEGSRRITTIMSGNNEFDIGEVRLVLVGNNGLLGGHWREYPEVWGFLGEATIILEDIETK